MSLPSTTPPLAPRFAVTGDGNWRTMLATIPDDLVSTGRSVQGLTVYGDDRGLGERLIPLAGKLRADGIWILADGDALTLVREGELDAAGLARRIDLAAAVAAALQA